MNQLEGPRNFEESLSSRLEEGLALLLPMEGCQKRENSFFTSFPSKKSGLMEKVAYGGPVRVIMDLSWPLPKRREGACL